MYPAGLEKRKFRKAEQLTRVESQHKLTSSIYIVYSMIYCKVYSIMRLRTRIETAESYATTRNSACR